MSENSPSRDDLRRDERRDDLSHDDLRRAALDALAGVAPDIDAAVLDAARPVRDQFDFDSMDFLNYVTALHDALGVDIPEADYAALASIDGSVEYLESKLAHRPSTE